MKITHLSIELGTGIFEKPQALGDYLVQSKSSSTLVICPNSSDIRFVENILRRRSLPARRISRPLDEKDLSQIYSWLEAQKNLILVCSAIIGTDVSKHWGETVIFYAPPVDPGTYQDICLEGINEAPYSSRAVLSLISPNEVNQFAEIKIYAQDCSLVTLNEQETIQAQKAIMDRNIKNLPSRGSVLATEITKQYANDLGLSNLEESSDKFTLIKKLSTFFMEQCLGSAPATSIEEELQIIEESSQDFIDAPPRSRENQSSNRGDDRSRDRYRDEGDQNARHQKPDNQHKKYSKPDHKKSFSDNGNRNKNPRERNDNNYRSSDNRGGDRDNRDFRDNRGGKKKNVRPGPQYFPVRVYVGLGEDNGLKPHEVKDFIAEVAQINREDVGFANLRTSYSFVDLTEEAAEKALSIKSGFEFEGKLVTVERALTSTKPPGRHSSNRRRNHEDQSSDEQIS